MNMKARINSFTAVAKWCTTQEKFGLQETAKETKQEAVEKGETNVSERTREEEPRYREQKGITLGGRSMGARAAVLTAASLLEDDPLAPHVYLRYDLILVSYPLMNTKGDKRDQILLDLPRGFSVLFIIGTRDTMCPLDQLEDVRKAMKATSWLLRVEGANHGMETKPKKMMEQVLEETGRVAAMWMYGGLRAEEKGRESRIWIEEVAEEKELVVKWSTWVEELEEFKDNNDESEKVDEVKPTKRNAKNTQKKASANESSENTPVENKTEEGGQTRIKKKASRKSAAEKPKTRKRKSATSQQDDSSTPDKRKRTKTTDSTTPSRVGAQADSASIASRTRSRKSAA